MAGQLSEFEKLLKSIDDGLVGFAAGLAAKGYRNEKRLRAASRDGLLSVDGVQQGVADLIISNFNRGAHGSQWNGVHTASRVWMAPSDLFWRGTSTNRFKRLLG